MGAGQPAGALLPPGGGEGAPGSSLPSPGSANFTSTGQRMGNFAGCGPLWGRPGGGARESWPHGAGAPSLAPCRVNPWPAGPLWSGLVLYPRVGLELLVKSESAEREVADAVRETAQRDGVHGCHRHPFLASCCKQ